MHSTSMHTTGIETKNSLTAAQLQQVETLQHTHNHLQCGSEGAIAGGRGRDGGGVREVQTLGGSMRGGQPQDSWS